MQMPKKASETKQTASWNEAKEKQMLTAFSAATTKYGGDGKSLKAAAWKEVTAAYNLASGDKLVNDQLQSKLGELKQKYSLLSGLVDLSGAEFEETSGVITMNDDNWDDVIAKNPKAKWFKLKKFPLWLLCNQLFKASTATGEFAQQIIKVAAKPRVIAEKVDDENDDDEDDANTDAHPDNEDDNNIDAHPVGKKTRPPPIKRQRLDENTTVLLKALKNITEKDVVDKDPSEVSFEKAVNEFKRIKSLEATPTISTRETVAIKEILASNHMLFNSLDGDEEKLYWIGQKLSWEED